ncbi:MAG: hypothetical protein QOF51_4362 [Chloroflexota bacterium]|nr:hypothetical protein [Chloroflexota bacterium]
MDGDAFAAALEALFQIVPKGRLCAVGGLASLVALITSVSFPPQPFSGDLIALAFWGVIGFPLAWVIAWLGDG